jgi:ATP-dependent Lhr-like helicase
MPLSTFHPVVAAWFASVFPAPTEAQALAWPAIAAGRHTLVAAPTGSGKTLTAFMAAIDSLVRQGLQGTLPDETQVIYVSPLKALSNDIHVNLDGPLAGIRTALAQHGLPDVALRAAVRTGDTPQAERDRLKRKPPHILVTTPESLYVLLGSVSGRKMLSTARTLIVDEIHAVAASKRGSHLALSMARLDALCGRPLVRVGLSATQKPIDEVARFLVGTGGIAPDGKPDCALIDIGHHKQRDLALELPPVPLSAVMSNDQWEMVYDRLAELVAQHRTTLVFVNTRRMAERAARHLGERLGKDVVAAHHGSLARDSRLDAEQRLKAGDLKVLVATASLELGIDIGDVDLVCQLGSPRSIAGFLQRVGRSGHAVGGVPKGRLFPQSRDDLIECAALLDSVRRGELDRLRLPPAPLDVLAQQIVAEVTCQDWDEDALYALVRQAWPYARLPRARFDEVVRMLAEGFTTRNGTRGAYVQRDAVNRRLHGRAGGRMTAVMSGGTIPDVADYSVILEPQSHSIGTVHEDFAVESIAGDVFQLGNASYRILKVEPGRVRVADAQGAPPSIPFWLGEAPGRSDELSQAVSRLRAQVAERFEADVATTAAPRAQHYLSHELQLGDVAAAQIVDYLVRTRAALGTVPTQQHLVIERFFDESGGTQLVIHSPYGSRLNRAWGLALRKRFCRQFNFELQAAATEDAIVLSLSSSHSFPLIDVARYLHSNTAEDVLVQALLDAPLFGVRWRWNATTALALPRFTGGRKVAPQLQRMRSEDLLAAVFPDQVACAENIVGEREVPEHPLVAQTLYDCLHEAMDTEGWLTLLRGLESGHIAIEARETTAPSPLAAEVLTARPYAFLDDAPLEERRTQAVMARRLSDPDHPDDLGRLDPAAIEDVRAQAWPQARDADEMHDALMGLGLITADDLRAQPEWASLLQALAADRRATQLVHTVALPRADAEAPWVAAERLPQARAMFPQATPQPAIEVPAEFLRPWTLDEALVEMVRSRLSGLGPATVARLAHDLGQDASDINVALGRLETEGVAMRGRFTPPATAPDAPQEWCERHLLARIHRYTIARLRREIEPVAPRDFMRFLFDWQRVADDTRMQGDEALPAIIELLEGYEVPAGAWEAELLPARLADYSPLWLDQLCTGGKVAWTRLRGQGAGASGGAGEGGATFTTLRTTPIVLLPRRVLALWRGLPLQRAEDDEALLSPKARRAAARLEADGASFFDELAAGAHLLPSELEGALTELVARGRAHCDSFAGLRALLLPSSKRPSVHGGRRGRRAAAFGLQDAGRWALVRRPAMPTPHEGTGRPGASFLDPDAVEHVARVLLRRYGMVCWHLLEREAPWLPPWRELLRVYQRLEARGEIRGGRFVAGLSGEQFALPEAVGLMRSVRRRPHDGTLVRISALDPLNLAGTLLPGAKVPRLAGARLVFEDGMPVASLVGHEVHLLQDGMAAPHISRVRQALI